MIIKNVLYKKSEVSGVINLHRITKLKGLHTNHIYS